MLDFVIENRRTEENIYSRVVTTNRKTHLMYRLYSNGHLKNVAETIPRAFIWWMLMSRCGFSL